MDEFELIRRYFVTESGDKNVIVGVGDDGAVLCPDPGRNIVTVVDTLVADVHFPSQLAAEDLGFRAVAVNVSDIAAMGGRPRWMTLALTLPNVEPDWLERFSRGLFQAAGMHGIELVGGDTTRGSEIVISLQVIGEVDAQRHLTRQGARPGDHIVVSGSTGDAAQGLKMLQDGASSDEHAAYLRKRFARPDARVDLGQAIAPFASAAIDLSDGLFADLGKLLAASGVGGCIELDQVPLSPALLAAVGREEALQLALSGGDDYELCFTVPANSLGVLSDINGVLLTCIGEVDNGAGLSCVRAGRAFAFAHGGYDHFNENRHFDQNSHFNENKGSDE